MIRVGERVCWAEVVPLGIGTGWMARTVSGTVTFIGPFCVSVKKDGQDDVKSLSPMSVWKELES